MFYEMVTGRLPFLAENSYGIMLKHISDTPIPPTRLNPRLPLGIEQIILCAMEKDVVNRYQSASQMLRHIYRIKKDPTTIFQKQTPAPRTPTAEVAIKRTTVFPDKQEQNAGRASKPNLTPPPKRQSAAPVRKKKRSPEYVPFSVVIVICIAFLVLAIIGFVILFNTLYNGKLAQTTFPLADMEQIRFSFRAMLTETIKFLRL